MVNQAIEKINKELSAFKGGNKEAAVKTAVASALKDFAKQDSEFAQAIVQNDKTLSDCCAEIMKGCGNSISDNEVYKRAVQYYFPGADIHFQMTIDLCPIASDIGTKPQESSSTWLISFNEGYAMPDKYKLLTAEERQILESFPTLTAQELEDINNMFQHYVFYKTVKGGRELSTSCCHHKYEFYPELQMLETYEHYQFLAAKHNDAVKCPYCGRSAILRSAGRGKGSLYELKQLVFLHSVNGELFAQAYWVSKDYIRRADHQEPGYATAAVYHFKLGRALMFYEDYYGDQWYCEREEGKIGKRIKVTEPFRKSGLFSGFEDYKVIHPEALAVSDLKYCQYREAFRSQHEAYTGMDFAMMRYLAAYCVYPEAVEMLMKNRMNPVVRTLIFDGKNNAAAIKWSEKDPRRAFGLTKEELRQFMCTRDRDVDLVAGYKKLRKAGVNCSIPQLDSVKRVLGNKLMEFIDSCLRYHITPQKFENYLNKYTGGCHAGGYRSLGEIYVHWKDYIAAASEIGYDLSHYTVCFPKDLQEAHDNATAEHNRRLRAKQEAENREREEKRRQQEEERAKRDATFAAELAERKRREETQRLKEIAIKKTRDKKYTFESNGYIIRPAHGAEEVIAEGNALQHCVGGYAARHEAGKLTICVMRLISEPNTPFLTIELNTDGKMQQVHGYKNEVENGIRIAENPRDLYKQILDPWLAWIAGGSKRDKQGNPIIKNMKKEANVA